MTNRHKQMQQRLLDLIRKNPGLNAPDLMGKGFRPMTHGSLRNAEIAGEIEWSGSGWYIKGQVPKCPIEN